MILQPLLYSALAFLSVCILYDAYVVKIVIKKEVFKELNRLLEDESTEVDITTPDGKLVTVVNLNIPDSTSRIFELSREKMEIESRLKITSIIFVILMMVTTII